MPPTTQTGEVQLRRGTSSAWASSTGVLLDGELGYDTTNKILKVGDGRQWSALDLTTLMKLDNPGVVGQTLQKSADGAAWQTLTLGSFVNVITETPEDHDAQRDGKVINNAAMNVGSPILTMPDTSQATFTSSLATNSAVIRVDGAGPSGGTLFSSVVSYQSPTQITLASSSSATVSSKAAIYGTDDTAAIKTAVTNAVARGLASGQNYAEVWFTAGIYMVFGALDTTQQGNAQIPLPFISETGPKFILNLVGSGDAALIPHWKQNVIQSGGPTIVTNLRTPYSSAHGIASVIGGPTMEGQGNPPNPGDRFMNMKLTTKGGLYFVSPRNPTGWAMDLQCVAQCDLDKIGFNASVIPAQSPSFADTAFTQWPTFGQGGGGTLRMPSVGNNDFCHVGSFAAEGYDIGIWPNEHAHIETATIVYCQQGVYCGDLTNDSILIDYLSTEACAYHIIAPSVSQVALNVTEWDVEDGAGPVATTFHLSDPNGAMLGELSYKHNLNHSPLVNGGSAVRLIDRGRIHGFQADPPAVPASGTPIKNPFFRDAFAYVAGGTMTGPVQVGVPGFMHSTGLNSGMIMVPTGLYIQLAYSAAPGWTWFLT